MSQAAILHGAIQPTMCGWCFIIIELILKLQIITICLLGCIFFGRVEKARVHSQKLGVECHMQVAWHILNVHMWGDGALQP